jgi:cold shock CspA family protein
VRVVDAEAGPQVGQVVRIGPERRFGYVNNKAGTRSYIFVVGRAISNREARHLRVGSDVHFEVIGQGRVVRLALV